MTKLLLLALALTLTGCATTALPTCDGSDRRPINAPPHAGVVHHSCGAAA